MADYWQSLLAASSNGDIEVLESLLINNEEQAPKIPEYPCRVNSLFSAAIEGRQPIETLDFLSKFYPKAGIYEEPMLAALETGNPKILAAVCRIDPIVAQGFGSETMINTLGYAALSPNAAELIKVLLDAGADPNMYPPLRIPSNWNVAAAICGGLPTSTFEQYYDAGYNGYEDYAVHLAVQQQRLDVLEVMFRRGRSKRLPYARFPPKEDLIRLAQENKDTEMVALIRRAYPGKGFFSELVSRFRSWLELGRAQFESTSVVTKYRARALSQYVDISSSNEHEKS